MEINSLHIAVVSACSIGFIGIVGGLIRVNDYIAKKVKGAEYPQCFPAWADDDKKPLPLAVETKDNDLIDNERDYDSLPEVTQLRAKINKMRKDFKDAEIAKFDNATTPPQLAAKAIAMKNIDSNVEQLVRSSLYQEFLQLLPDGIINHIIDTGNNVFDLSYLHICSFQPNADRIAYAVLIPMLGDGVFRLLENDRHALSSKLHRAGFHMEYDAKSFSITVTPIE